MDKLIDAIDFNQLSSDIEEIKKEILNDSDESEYPQDNILLEVIRVIQEEILNQNRNSQKSDLENEVKFLAYLNLFNSIMKEGFDDDEEWDEDDEEFEEEFDEEQEEEDADTR